METAQPSPLVPNQLPASGPENQTSFLPVDASVKRSPATIAATQASTAGSRKPPVYQ